MVMRTCWTSIWSDCGRLPKRCATELNRVVSQLLAVYNVRTSFALLAQEFENVEVCLVFSAIVDRRGLPNLQPLLVHSTFGADQGIRT